jgi:hypothetical protein
MRLYLARGFITAVFIVNVQCAIVFLLWPGSYVPGFELHGEPGEAMVRGMGILFLMWNVPYAVALYHPRRYRMALFEAVTMQAIGLAGETFVYSALPHAHELARLSILRFIAFDALGLLALLAAVWISRRPMQHIDL